MPRLFDRYVFVDWSGAACPTRGANAIWFATGTVDEVSLPHNPATRTEAVAMLRALLLCATARRERVLIGFDFPYGFPAGFAAALGLTDGRPPWRAAWAMLRDSMRDSDNNGNRRFDDAARLNEAIGSPPGPFWGHPSGFVSPVLTWNVSFPFRTAGGQTLRELRHTERHLRTLKRLPFPVWKLAGQGAVGSQALLGIPRVAALRDDPNLASFSCVWPFETGFNADPVPNSGPFVLHAEIWPGVLEPDPGSHPVADARQVLALVQWARRLDIGGELVAEFSTPESLTSDQIEECVREEGWTLGATNLSPRKAKPEPRSSPSSAQEHTSVKGDDARYHI
jgi:precorrin-8X/cobalt-precorrin-8 methylmutase